MTTCTFAVTVFSGCLQDDSNPGNDVVFNLNTGEYRWCCGGVLIAAGTGTVTRQGCTFSIQHDPLDRRVRISIDFAARRGNASLQLPPGKVKCTITDRNITNDTCSCSGAPQV
jgi:hypothetical protein